MSKTEENFDTVISECHNLFNKKMIDYGSAWRILRLSSLTDQIFIKAQRIRSIEEKENNKSMILLMENLEELLTIQLLH